MHKFTKLLSVLTLSSFFLTGIVFPQSSQNNFPTKRTETPETWKSGGKAAIQRAKQNPKFKSKAKNVILFIGDGMGISTITAARILEGQMRGTSGEENLLSFEQFPYSAFSRTYSANQQTSDSAPTMSAIMTGVKTDEGVISLNQNVIFNDYNSVEKSKTMTMLEMAENAGKSTGVVSTARLTHATPAACYAHSPNRNWESDADIYNSALDAYNNNFPDIARQLIEFPYGDGLEVALGGGRTNFLPRETADPEYSEKTTGRRLDKRDLPQEWKNKRPHSEYVWNKQQFNAIDVKKTKHLLGLFEPSHLKYEYDRKNDKAGEPSLSEMTAKAIDVLSNNKKGYFLMVEAGRIDHAHHDGNAFHALTDAIELSNAVRTAQNKVDLKDTLIIVTADHSHVFTIAGYPARGNNILGLTRDVDRQGNPADEPSLDSDKKPYTTLGYANGPGYKKGERPELTQEEVTNPDYKQEATVPSANESHGGEDVAIFATGAGSGLVHGSMEENWIFFVMAEALRFEY